MDTERSLDKESQSMYVRESKVDKDKECTLKEIFNLLKLHFRDYTNISDRQAEKVSEMNKRRESKQTLASASVDPKHQQEHLATSPTMSEEKIIVEKEQDDIESETFDTGNLHIHSRLNSTSTTLVSPLPTSNHYFDDIQRDILSSHNIAVMQENVDLKLQMQQILQEVKGLRRERGEDEDASRHLHQIDKILSKVLRTQKKSEMLCDKLCEGIDNIKTAKDKLPIELKEFCDQIRQTVGQDYRRIGRELGIEPLIISEIEKEYSEEDECLHQIVLEWCKEQRNPSVHALVAACHNVNPDIIGCKPLPVYKQRLLEKYYNFCYDEMVEVAVLPHLISSGLISLKTSRYILKSPTKDQRIARLFGAIFTRKNGYDELLKALDMSKQHHVSDTLRDALDSSPEELHLNENTETRMETIHFETTNLPEPPYRRRVNSLPNELDSDAKSCISEDSFASSPPNLDSNVILRKIKELLYQFGI